MNTNLTWKRCTSCSVFAPKCSSVGRIGMLNVHCSYVPTERQRARSWRRTGHARQSSCSRSMVKYVSLITLVFYVDIRRPLFLGVWYNAWPVINNSLIVHSKCAFRYCAAWNKRKAAAVMGCKERGSSLQIASGDCGNSLVKRLRWCSG